MQLNKYSIDCSTQKTRPVYQRRYKRNGEEYLKKVDEIDIEEDLKDKKLEISRIKEIFDTKDRLKENQLVEEYTEETKIKELELMQNYENIDTYTFLNRTLELEHLYNKMPEEVRKNYKDLSRFAKEYLPEFTNKTKANLEQLKTSEKQAKKEEIKTQTKEEIQAQINELNKKLEGATNENV